MTDTQISVLRDALNSYVDYCVACYGDAKAIGNLYTSANWYTRGHIAEDMLKGIDEEKNV